MKKQAFYFPIFIWSLFLFFSLIVKSQHQLKADSLTNLLKATREDTTRLNILTALAKTLTKLNLDSAVVVGNRMVGLAETISDPKKLAVTYNAAGGIYFLKGDYPGALKFQFKALKIAEENNLERLCGDIRVAIGNTFMMEYDFPRSLTYYQEAFVVFKKANALNEMAKIYSNIGLLYAYQKQCDTALYYFNLSLSVRNKVPDEREKAVVYDYIGFACINSQQYSLGVKYLDSALLVNRKLNSTLRVLDNLRNRGECYLNLKNYRLAEQDLKESLELSTMAGQLNGIEGNYYLLSELYKKTGDFTKALDYYKKHIVLRDSIYNSDNTRKSLQQEVKFEYDKKALADSIHRVEEKKLAAEQLKVEQTKRYALYGGLMLTALFSLFMVNRFRITNKQKKVIEEQKKIVEEQKSVVEEKQKEVIDSIHYAKRIQLSLLAGESYIGKNLNRLKGK